MASTPTCGYRAHLEQLPPGTKHYHFNIDRQGKWEVTSEDPNQPLAKGQVATAASYVVIVKSDGTVRTFTVNGTVVANLNDGLTFNFGSSVGLGAGGMSGDSALFSQFSCTPL